MNALPSVVPSPLHVTAQDPLFAERLEVFLHKTLNDIRDFAQREDREFEEVRNQVALWHCKHLFDPMADAKAGLSTDDPTRRVQEVLIATSQTLETLLQAAGRHSLLLVVNPADDQDEGLLGGTVTGREYWRGLRNGGAAGARNFKQYCKKNLHLEPIADTTIIPEAAQADVPLTSMTGRKKTPASLLKDNLYIEMRTALRNACGVRNAEMKWSKPGKLSVYGVELIGWPAAVEFKNPSRMSLQESSTIMKLLKDGTIQFISKKNSDTPSLSTATRGGLLEAPGKDPCASDGVDADLSWAINDSGDDGDG